MVYLAAKRLGCSHTTVYNYIGKYASVKREFEFQRGEMLDAAELKLREAILEGKPWALQFALRTIGRDRGYVERREQEVSGPEGGPVPVQITEVIVKLPDEPMAEER
jgi:hypothetical protein